MRLRTLLAALYLAIAVPATWAVDAPTKRVIELKDGGQVVLRADGTMSHYDASGIPVAMPEGIVMTTKNGTRIMMKDASLWQRNHRVGGGKLRPRVRISLARGEGGATGYRLEGWRTDRIAGRWGDGPLRRRGQPRPHGGRRRDDGSRWNNDPDEQRYVVEPGRDWRRDAVKTMRRRMRNGSALGSG